MGRSSSSDRPGRLGALASPPDPDTSPMPPGTTPSRPPPRPDSRWASAAWSSLALALLATGLPSGHANADDATWRAGVARVVVTPETGVWLAGYGTKRAPDGKLHDLWAKALALEDAQGRRAVLVTSDFQGVPRAVSDRVFERLRAELGLERHQVMLTFSHNHCGPRLGDDLVDYYPIEAEQVALVDAYTDLMVERLVRLVGESLATLAPARLQAGEGRATFALN